MAKGWELGPSQECWPSQMRTLGPAGHEEGEAGTRKTGGANQGFSFAFGSISGSSLGLEEGAKPQKPGEPDPSLPSLALSLPTALLTTLLFPSRIRPWIWSGGPSS